MRSSLIVFVMFAASACTVIPPGSGDGGAGCSCVGRSCGSDGCGGSCGTCSAGRTCSASGVCRTGSCTPDCSGRSCGPDPLCGTSCGSCDDGNICTSESCSDGECLYGNVTMTWCENDLNAMECSRGTAMRQGCGSLALDSGSNGTFGCEDGRCRTTNFADRPTCRDGEHACAENSGVDYLGICRTSGVRGTYWHFISCVDVCIEDGWTRYTGTCEVRAGGLDVCLCS